MEEEEPRSVGPQYPKLPSVPTTPLKSDSKNADLMDIDSNGRAVSVLSIEDAEKLAAAAALSDLQAGTFIYFLCKYRLWLTFCRGSISVKAASFVISWR